MKAILILTLLIFTVPNLLIGQRTLTITVIDKKDNHPVDSAEVLLSSMNKEYTELKSEKKFTDKNGKCQFPIDSDKEFIYRAFASKDKYYPFFNKDNEWKSESGKAIEPQKEKKITLFLTSDTSTIIEYYSLLIPDISIDELINSLRSNTYRHRNVPDLDWNDISKLLEIGNSEIIITNYPENPALSTIHRECYLGTIALWLIETIRQYDGEIVHPIHKLTTIRQYLADDKKQREEKEKLLIAYNAYKGWWEIAQKIGKAKAKKRNPLENTGLHW